MEKGFAGEAHLNQDSDKVFSRGSAKVGRPMERFFIEVPTFQQGLFETDAAPPSAPERLRETDTRSTT